MREATQYPNVALPIVGGMYADRQGAQVLANWQVKYDDEARQRNAEFLRKRSDAAREIYGGSRGS